MSDQQWYGALLFGDLVKFVHQAIEWENILYFLYPYFWGSESIGREKMLFEHPDPEHERFLRAGYARVMLPVRPGFEEDFTRLMETGSLGSDATHPYMTVADDIKDFARTNYGGVPPANPDIHAVRRRSRSTGDMGQDAGPDGEDRRVQGELRTLPRKLADCRASLQPSWWTVGQPVHIQVPGLGADYDLVSVARMDWTAGKSRTP